MKNCPNCGTEITTDFCYNCGWRGDSDSEVSFNENYNETEVVQDDGFLGNNRLSARNGLSATIMAKDWFAYFGVYWLISLVPLVGPLASLIYSIVLLCRNETAPSIRGLIKFQLIMAAVLVVLSIILIVVLLVIGVGCVEPLPLSSSKAVEAFGSMA